MSSNDTMEVAEQHALIGNAEASKPDERTAHPDAQWFPEAKWGLFFHWGLSSVLGQCDLSWGMMRQPRGTRRRNFERYGWENFDEINLSPAKYWEQAKEFRPDRYDPDRWLAAAREAGVRYAVLTTRHHDGFALWPSEYGDFNTRNYAGGIDLVGKFIAACRKNGIKVGLYYSPPDWRRERDFMSFSRDPETGPLDMYHRPCVLRRQTPEEEAEHRAYLRGQVTELLSNYGKIDLLWLDGCFPEFRNATPENAGTVTNQTMTMEEIHALQPGIVMNRRGHLRGDFSTPECAFPKERPEGWWEFCYTFNSGGWGYRRHELYKPAGYLLKCLGESCAWGGNLLANVCPDPHGEMPEVYYRRLKQVAGWMKENRDVIFDAVPGEWPAKSNVPVLRRGETVYALVNVSEEEKVELRLDRPPLSVVLRTDGGPVPYRYENGVLSFDLEDDRRSLLTDVVEIKTAKA